MNSQFENEVDMPEKEVQKKTWFQAVISMVDMTLLKFLMVGVINTLVGTSTMFLLYNYAGRSYYFSSAANYIVGGICSFLLNKFFTFKAHSERNETGKKKFAILVYQILKFALTVFIAYYVSYTLSRFVCHKIFYMYSEKVRDNIAMFCGMCGYVVLNYLAQRLWVFRKKAE